MISMLYNPGNNQADTYGYTIPEEQPSLHDSYSGAQAQMYKIKDFTRVSSN